MTVASEVAADGQEIEVHVGGQDLMVSWHPPAAAPAGTRHGAEGICVSSGGVVLVNPDGQGWSFPAGRPEAEESWEETLRREVREEGCATVIQARLLGFSRGVCIAGPENGLVLVRSIWRADVELERWDPHFEIRHRRLVARANLAAELTLASHPFAPIVRRALQEAGLT